MNLAEYIKGFLGIIAIIFFGIGIVVWKFRVADEIQEIEKKIDVDTKKVIESDLKVLSDVSFPAEIDIRKMYGVISAGEDYMKKYFGPSLALGIVGLISGSIAWLMGIEYLGYIAVFCFLLSGIVNTDRW